jgi:hypothetical protein
MSDARLTPHDGEDVVGALSLADRHIEDAENVLWNATKGSDEEDVAAALEELTRDVWDLQHRIEDLQRTIE